MKDGHGSARRRSTVEGPAIQVICLGAGGGPSEDNVTGFLVRSTSSDWAKGSILAVDAGCHLAAIQRILEKHFPVASEAEHIKIEPEGPRLTAGIDTTDCSDGDGSDSVYTQSKASTPEPVTTVLETGPFAGLTLPHQTARANAVHVVREHVSTYLITHPHLDHFVGFAINTAAFHNTSRPKRLAALPFTVNAIKTHIFNDIVWPNLTDEDNGVGFVTFQRLTEGGNLALGEGHSRGFIEVCDGLAAKGFKVSHGRCAATPRVVEYPRRGSNAATVDPGGANQHMHMGGFNGASTQPPPAGVPKTPVPDARRSSIFSQPSQPGTPTVYQPQQQDFTSCVVDSSAYFIRDDATGREILMFGDVEPDSISYIPRNHVVWAEAAPKIAQGILSGIFIECSYNDTQKDAVLFGHLAPRHLAKELETLADMVSEKRKENADKLGRKRKRHSMTASKDMPEDTPRSTSRFRSSHRISTPTIDEMSTDASADEKTPAPRSGMTDVEIPPTKPHQPALQLVKDDKLVSSVPTKPYDGPLKGVQVVVIHVKDTMADGPLVGETILQDLWAHEHKLSKQGRPLGCTFQIATSGATYFF